ncbi:DUF4169 family protein [Roseococcus suduntuyensis]|uniref:DUF4169 domain-containing protein n=1 Tax=Roseococcus suduntuyensis TaxID=455361 RepID=A0A840ACS6_9PROT|nr:DUF4169 family protein [Roseococcus suduntuyensis]MBB3898326.1 hypothetical protein [Roseococcus suduntuyensis]
MAEVVNLRKWRAAKAKTEAEVQAAANRVAFGRTKGQKARDAAEEARRRTLLDQARREDEPPGA